KKDNEKTESRRKTSSDQIITKLNDAKNQNFNPTQTIWSQEKESLLALDEQIKKIGFFNRDNYKIFLYKDILRSEILVDGAQITKTSRTSQLGGAILGGVIAGGVGAIIGGLSASQETTNEVKRIDLSVIVNDSSMPQLLINLVTSERTLTKENTNHYMGIARHWHNLMSVLIHQADVEDEKNAAIQSSKVVSNSIADEIEKLALL
ncbi:hypothetical protein NXY55_25175, partial [Aeromonas veronii]|nr:hypothetical protein [Aeromonas veronii]